MTKENLLKIIEDEASSLGIKKEKAIDYLNQFGLSIDKILDNPRIDENRVRGVIIMGNYIFS